MTPDTPTLRAFPSEFDLGPSLRDQVAKDFAASMLTNDTMILGARRLSNGVPESVTIIKMAFEAADAFMKQREVGL